MLMTRNLIRKKFERNQLLLLVFLRGLLIFFCKLDLFILKFSINVRFRFYEVYCEVEPKRLALEKANAELKAARDKLDVVNRQVAVCCF
jgi:hypothetical protein